MLNKLSNEALFALMKNLKRDRSALEKLADVADIFDSRGCFDAANKVDILIDKINEEASAPGRAFAKWLRHLKKADCPEETMVLFKTTYKTALKEGVAAKNNTPEKFALQKAIKCLPTKYC
jgi:hypothetical protein